MTRLSQRHRALNSFVAAFAGIALFAACGTMGGERQPRSTTRDRTIVGAGVGAVVGAAGAVIAGKEEADEILAGAAIGAVVGGGVGAYMDAQEEKLARIPGTSVERVSDDTLLVNFDSDVLFDTDSSALRGASQSTLDQVASVIQEYPKTALVIHQLSTRKSQSPFRCGPGPRPRIMIRPSATRSGTPLARVFFSVFSVPPFVWFAS